MSDLLKHVISGQSLTAAHAESCMERILLQQMPGAEVGALLTALHFLPPATEILTGFARALRARAVTFSVAPETVDVCGTGGDGQGTFNISTTVAFVVAAAGATCAKHGNRAVSSRCGSFDVLEALGIPFVHNEVQARASLSEFGLAFMYAPAFHPSFNAVAELRRCLGFRTVFNILGPLLNPARVKRQLIGVYAENLVLPVAETLRELGSKRALVVHGHDAQDEISVCAPTTVAELKNNELRLSRIAPEDFALPRATAEELRGGSASENADLLSGILQGERGARRNSVVLNAAAGLVAAGLCENLHEGVARASHTLDSGSAYDLLLGMGGQFKRAAKA